MLYTKNELNYKTFTYSDLLNLKSKYLDEWNNKIIENVLPSNIKIILVGNDVISASYLLNSYKLQNSSKIILSELEGNNTINDVEPEVIFVGYRPLEDYTTNLNALLLAWLNYYAEDSIKILANKITKLLIPEL